MGHITFKLLLLAIPPSHLLAQFRAAEVGGVRLRHPETWGTHCKPWKRQATAAPPAQRGCHSGNNINKTTCGRGPGRSTEPPAGRSADNGVSRASGQRPRGDSALAEGQRSESASRGNPGPAAPPGASLPVPPPRALSRTLARGARPPGTQPSGGSSSSSSSNSSRGGIPGRTGGAIQRGCAGILPGRVPAPAAPAALLDLQLLLHPLLRRSEATRRLQAHGPPRARQAAGTTRVESSPGRREAAEGGVVDSLAGRGLLSTSGPWAPHGEVGAAGGGTRCDRLGDPGDKREGPAGQCTWGSGPRPSACAPRPATGPQRPILLAAASPPGPSPSCGPVEDSARRRGAGWKDGVERRGKAGDFSPDGPLPIPLLCSPAQALFREVQFPLLRLVSAPGGILWRHPPPKTTTHIWRLLIISGPIRYGRGLKII